MKNGFASSLTGKFLLAVWMLFLHVPAMFAARTELDNGEIRLTLGVDDAGVPLISKCILNNNATVFTDAETGKGWNAWLPAPTISDVSGSDDWTISENPIFLRGETSRVFGSALKVTWMVDLARHGTLFRTSIQMTNLSERTLPIDWYPVWNASWKMRHRPEWVRWWESLSFCRTKSAMNTGQAVNLSSRLHSSDEIENGVNPYWVLGGRDGHICFGLEWCGGWKAIITGTKQGADFSVWLPPEETQLILDPGQSIHGPVLHTVITRESDDSLARADWMRQRVALAQERFAMPPPAFYLGYNNWYTTRFQINGEFLRRQVNYMAPFGFDAFVIDAGWYKNVGDWTPDETKFQPGEFESLLKSAGRHAGTTGIWTCPQFVHAPADAPPSQADRPGFYREFIDGHLLDLDGCNFSELLKNHVAFLRNRYGIAWWKYDQDFFMNETRAGVMRNVIAFQEALKAVRHVNPDLIIENCQSGGRMINELTVQACQTQWLRDGGNNGLEHARQNIRVALGAMEFVFPWQACRWTNNISRMSPDDRELIRYYCRSAMAGSWGIVDDLSNLTDAHRRIILEEIQNYRRLNESKTDCLYDLILPTEGGSYAGVLFFTTAKERAAAIFCRWDGKDTIQDRVLFKHLNRQTDYRVENPDSHEIEILSGECLIQEGLPIVMEPEKWSLIYLLSAV
ncbi:MAG TPA: alpha-galactosidase [bacterium]|nr:alpha-galactosidase [bacterium]HQO33098.1 alpha-galactosidase [bacterium]HQP98618.1 alpha-galactosidase [bacterium]